MKYRCIKSIITAPDTYLVLKYFTYLFSVSMSIYKFRKIADKIVSEIFTMTNFHD